MLDAHGPLTAFAPKVVVVGTTLRNIPTWPEPQDSLEQVEAAHIQRVLDHTGGHKGRSCEILGISRPALDRKIDKYALVLPGR